MVHKAIREQLGETATQAGSENAPGRFRFDFTAQAGIPSSQLGDIEARVNAVLLEDLPVHADVMTQQQALDIGAMALFGEKYGDRVRVVSVGEWARELCGGTHTQHTSQLGVVKLLGESSIGSGVRRVEALVGGDAYTFLAREHAIVGQLTEVLKGRPEDLPERVSAIVARLREAEKEISAARQQQVMAAAPRLVEYARDVGPVRLVTHDAGEGVEAGDLRTLVLDVRARLADERPAVVAMTAASGGKPVVVVATNAPARAAGVRAGALARLAAQVLGGGGGGKDDLAQGGGTDSSRMGEALGAVETILREHG
jgi:alanyl-tRNA synthetase